MLLRDLLRGASSIAEKTEEISQQVLPEPVRQPLRSAIRAIEGESTRILGAGVDIEQIRSAAAFLKGKSGNALDAEMCAKVLAFAWEKTRPAEEGSRHLVSETLLALHLASNGENGRRQYERAASVFLVLRRSNAAGSLPGFPLSSLDRERRAIELRLFAYFIWLLSDRAASIEEELRLLTLANSLTQAFGSEILERISDSEFLAAQFDKFSKYLAISEIPLEAGGADACAPMRESARNLRWLVYKFEERVRHITAETGISYLIDYSALAKVLTGWLKSLLEQERPRSEEKVAFVGFAAGMMLRELLCENPAKAVSGSLGTDASTPANFWPEGYLYVVFCINVRGMVLEHDYHVEQRPGETIGDIGTWWSFKENVEEDPAMAIAFLDHFAGADPQWTVPDLFRNRNDH